MVAESSSYDQGIFNRVLWNSGHSRWFASSLSPALQCCAQAEGGTDQLSRLGRHYTPLLLLWAPWCIGWGWRLAFGAGGVDDGGGVGVAPAGLRLLPAGLAAAVACSFTGPGGDWPHLVQLSTFASCRALFLLLLGLLERRWWLLLLAALLIPLVREDTVVLFGMALWRASPPGPWWVAALIGL